VFANRKTEVAVLHKSLVKHGFKAVALHGDMDQRARMAALEDFKTGDANILVASDVAARGLDIPAVSHVFNYDVPFHADDYVHRIGRTGRAGRAGAAFSLVTPHDSKAVAAIEKLIGQTIAFDGPTVAELPPSTATGQDERPRARGRERSAPRERDRDRHRDGQRVRPAREERILEKAAAESARNEDDRDDAAPKPAPVPAREPREPRAPRRAAAHESARIAGERNGAERNGADASRHPAPVPPREPRAPRRDTPAPRREPRARDDDGPSVIGLGDHMPAFLMQPPRKT
jgi:superfamily II DNA/RNA helicase